MEIGSCAAGGVNRDGDWGGWDNYPELPWLPDGTIAVQRVLTNPVIGFIAHMDTAPDFTGKTLIRKSWKIITAAISALGNNDKVLSARSYFRRRIR